MKSGDLSLSLETCSFILFAALSAVAIAIFRDIYWVFLLLLVVDGVATLLKSDATVSTDRSLFFIALVLASVATAYSIFLLFLEVVLVIGALDVSFLLRTLEGTAVEPSVISRRLESYAYTLLPAFLVSSSLAYIYSSLTGLLPQQPLALLAAASTLALVMIFSISRFLSAPFKGRR